jgi:hypothetical protein
MRALDRPLSELVPEPMRRCGDFGEAVISTDEESDVIPICDAIKDHEIASQAMMASLLPESAWARMLRKTVARSHGWPIGGKNMGASVPAMVDAAISWGLIQRLPAESTAPQPLASLAMMGALVSQRKLGDAWVKLFIQGNRANAGHTHEDTEKNSLPERRRPRRHQHLIAMTLRQLCQTQCIKMWGQFLRFMDSNACLA